MLFINIHILYTIPVLQCASARLSFDGSRDMGATTITDSTNTYIHNNTSHLSPKSTVVSTASENVSKKSWNTTSANKSSKIESNSYLQSAGETKMTSAAVTQPGTGGPAGVRQNLNELDLLLSDLSKARYELCYNFLSKISHVR